MLLIAPSRHDRPSNKGDMHFDCVDNFLAGRLPNNLLTFWWYHRLSLRGAVSGGRSLPGCLRWNSLMKFSPSCAIDENRRLSGSLWQVWR